MPKDQPYLEAEKKIQEALKSGATELDLSQGYSAQDDVKLTELPDSLWQFTKLQKLNLANNKLTALPASLGQLAQLTELNLSSNQLTTLPDSLGQLTQLQSLLLTGNQLTVLPHFIKLLTNLKEFPSLVIQFLKYQNGLTNSQN